MTAYLLLTFLLGLLLGMLFPVHDETVIAMMEPQNRMTITIRVVALAKGSELYVFVYDDASRKELMHTLGRFASNPELSFTWYDAAVLSSRAREIVE